MALALFAIGIVLFLFVLFMKTREDEREERRREAHKRYVEMRIPHVFGWGAVAGEILAMGDDPDARASYNERTGRWTEHTLIGSRLTFEEEYDRYLQMKDRELFHAFEAGLKAGRRKHEDRSLVGLRPVYDPKTRQVTWEPHRLKMPPHLHNKLFNTPQENQK